MGAKRKIEIRKVSRFGIWITLFLALAFVFLIIQGENEFFAMNESPATKYSPHRPILCLSFCIFVETEV